MLPGAGADKHNITKLFLSNVPDDQAMHDSFQKANNSKRPTISSTGARRR